MSPPSTLIDVEVPASLSNMGPGLDTLGMSIDLYNRFRFFPLPPGRFEHEGEAIAPEQHLSLHTACRAARYFRTTMPIGLGVASEDGLPRARGLGSSSTARIAGLLAFLESTGLQPPEHEVLAFLTAEEGHPDNALPSYLGGLVTCMTEGGEVCHRRLPLGADFEIVLCIPDRLVPTQQARAVLPAHPPLADAVFNLQRLALLVAGFLTGDLEAIRMGAADRLHQLQRASLIGPLKPALHAAHELGAAAFVSGSGSTLAAVVGSGTPTAPIGEALAAPFRAEGITCQTITTRPISTGWRRSIQEED